MKFRFEQTFETTRDELFDVMFKKGAVEEMKGYMTSIVDAETLEWKNSKGRVSRRVRYQPAPLIREIGPKKVDPKWMEWVEELEFDKKEFIGRFRNVPTNRKVAELLENSGVIEFIPVSNGTTMRAVHGDLRVKVFLLGSIAERVIHVNAKKIIEEEASVLKRYFIKK
ncbi:MAG: hypothetical protein FJ088_16725 [Deltaproteobacteria bacterium]|nr:hypothetical protein [Deltaproteobacteria bacterium]